MDLKVWEQISKDYEVAKICLWCPDKIKNWHRDEDKGFYHMWKAYYSALTQEEKELLVYARILVMMAHERRFSINNYDCFHKYIEPAMQAYNDAINLGENIPEQELESIKRDFESLEYELKKEEEYEEAYALIEGLNEIENFGFHDSKPVYFEHNEKDAYLDLDYDNNIVRFNFIGVYEIEINGDPTCNYINDFFCYRWWYNKEILYFDIGYYRIKCSKIVAIKKENV